MEGHQLGVVSVDLNNGATSSPILLKLPLIFEFLQTEHVCFLFVVAVSSSLDSNIRIWDMESGKQRKLIDAGPGMLLLFITIVFFQQLMFFLFLFSGCMDCCFLARLTSRRIRQSHGKGELVRSWVGKFRNDARHERKVRDEHSLRKNTTRHSQSQHELTSFWLVARDFRVRTASTWRAAPSMVLSTSSTWRQENSCTRSRDMPCLCEASPSLPIHNSSSLLPMTDTLRSTTCAFPSTSFTPFLNGFKHKKSFGFAGSTQTLQEHYQVTVLGC